MADDYDPDRLQTERPSGTPMVSVRPKRKPEDDDKGDGSALSPAMRGVLDHIVAPGESSGKYNVIYGGSEFSDLSKHPNKPVLITSGPNKGLHSTAAGKYQFIKSTWDEAANATGKSDFSKKSQDTNAAWLAKKTYKDATGRDIEADYASGDPKLREGIRNALASQWESLGKPGPRVDKLDADGKPSYRFSDHAMNEHDGRPNTDLVYMTPGQYLDLSPVLEKPFDTPSGKALKKSFDKGDAIESVPTLDVNVDGDRATVTDQDGRHRALLAQQNDVMAIPVAIQKTGEGKPTEIVGADGKSQAYNHPPVKRPAAGTMQEPEQPKEPISLMGQIGDALMPRAEAAEPPQGDAKQASPSTNNPFAEFAPPAGKNPFAEFAPPAQGDQQQEVEPWAGSGQGIGSALMAGWSGAAKGLGETARGGEELVGKGMEAAGIPGGQWVTDNARAGIADIEAASAPSQAAHPIAGFVGDVVGGSLVPGGAMEGAARMGMSALRSSALGGAIGGLLTPSGNDDTYWRDKVIGTGVGTAAGAGAEKAGNLVAHMVAPNLRPSVDLLVKEGVQLTPGQMAGGAAKRLEDTAGSIPVLGSQIAKAQQRSFETFNRAAINRGLSDIGTELPKGLDSGFNAIGWAQDAFSRAYDQVIPRMVGRLDSGLQNDLNAVLARAQADNLPKDTLDELKFAIEKHIIEPFRLNRGQITGVDAQRIGSMLDTIINPKRGGNTYDQIFARHLRDADKALDDMLDRQNPILATAKAQIDRGYAQFKTVQHATGKVGSAPDGTFTPAQLFRSVAEKDRSKDKAMFKRGDAMMQDLANAARDVLPQKVPNSGTAERALLMGILGGGAHFEPHLGAAAILGSVPYTAPASRAMNAALGKLANLPPPGAGRNALMNMSRMGGQALAPAAGSGAAAMVPSLLPGGSPQQ